MPVSIGPHRTDWVAQRVYPLHTQIQPKGFRLMAKMGASNINILRPLWDNLGVEAALVEWTDVVSCPPAESFRTMLNAHGVILIRDFPEAPIHQLRITALLGKTYGVQKSGFTTHVAPDLRIESDTRINPYNAQWHSDTSWAEAPARYTLLYAQSIQGPCAGTQLVDTSRAYAALPQARREAISQWRAYHHVEQSRKIRFSHQRPSTSNNRLAALSSALRKRLHAWRRERSYGLRLVTKALPQPRLPGALHPVVSVDPVTHRTYLTLGEHAWMIEGMTVEQSLYEIDRLTSEITRNPLTHVWKPRDLLIFDNRMLLHRRQPDMDPYERSVRRELRRTLAWVADAR